MGVVKRIFVMGSAGCATDTEALPRPAVSQVRDQSDPDHGHRRGDPDAGVGAVVVGRGSERLRS